jgi:hypothetical protein
MKNILIFTGLIICTFLSTASPVGSKPDPDIETLRKRVKAIMMQPDINESKVKDLMTSIQAEGKWPDINYADIFAEWAALVAGTKYSLNNASINQLIDYYLDGICQSMVFGKYPGKISSLSVSDPGRNLGKIHLSISARVEKRGDNFRSVWDESRKVSDISVDLPLAVFAGESVTINIKNEKNIVD